MKPEVVIFDIDGVIRNNSQALHDYIEAGQGNCDWQHWYTIADDHPVHEGWVRLYHMLQRFYKTIFLTNRDASSREITEAALARDGLRPDVLKMWDPAKYSYPEFKEQTVRDLLVGVDIVLAIDDDPQHIAMYERLGVVALHASHGLVVREAKDA